jgi:fumarate hydratase, class II
VSKETSANGFSRPAEAVGGHLWGAATERAIKAFPVSGQPMPEAFLRALVVIKQCAAEANRDLGVLDPVKARAIAGAAQEILDGGYWDQFPVDLYQTGSGTSSNMNANEVIAALSGKYLPAGVTVHPNDDVNKGQSSNDVVPTAMRICIALALRQQLVPALERLRAALAAKVEEFWPVVKLARTHIQDATPIRLGQEFLGYHGQLETCLDLTRRTLVLLRPVPLGGTATGTGINTHPDFARATCERVSSRLGVTVTETGNHFNAQSTLDTVLAAHADVRTIALSLGKIASDIRLLATGPRAGLGELVVPDAGVTSSIMPGKNPPVVIESLLMVIARVVGNDTVLAYAQTGSILELNLMMPVATASALESVSLLAAAAANFANQCVAGLEATEQGPRNVGRGVMLATALTPFIGYDAASAMTKEALENGEDIRDVAARKGFTPEQLAEIFDPAKMTGASDAPPLIRAPAEPVANT